MLRLAPAHGQAGPPFLTNDPGTPGDANWEINIASMNTLTRGAASYQTPQIDLNFGLGNRVQLTYEMPYILQSNAGQPRAGGWGNGYPGLKWRFLDQGENGWQMSLFPQVETSGSPLSRRSEIAEPGPRYLLPLEVTRTIGGLGIDVEVGYYVAGHGPKERILGLVVGRPVTERLELGAELYDDHADGAAPHATTLDLGGRYRLRPGMLALFMAGRSVNGLGDGQPTFIGYVGIQLLLSHYGRSFSQE
jgi:hypothetical protein